MLVPAPAEYSNGRSVGNCLLEFTAEELLAGANAYECEKCCAPVNKKVYAMIWFIYFVNLGIFSPCSFKNNNSHQINPFQYYYLILVWLHFFLLSMRDPIFVFSVRSNREQEETSGGPEEVPHPRTAHSPHAASQTISASRWRLLWFYLIFEKKQFYSF